MILSLFIREKEFHISDGQVDRVYTVEERCELADMITSALKDYIDNINFEIVDTILYSNGPDSFTTMRIMTSLVKGIAIVSTAIKFIGMSNFLTYMYKASETAVSGRISIPTMRGDFFVCDYNNYKLSEVQTCESLNKQILLNNNEIFNDINLAKIQYDCYKHNINILNNKYTCNTTETRYGITPKYNN